MYSFTPKQQQSFIDSKGQVCPYCNSLRVRTIEQFRFDPNFNGIGLIDMACMECQTSWTLVLSLTCIKANALPENDLDKPRDVFFDEKGNPVEREHFVRTFFRR